MQSATTSVGHWGSAGVIIVRSKQASSSKKKEKKKTFHHTNYTYKEQRRRILTISFKKCMKISNPESILNINNMLINIQDQIVSEASNIIQVKT